jgi:hypothetical protein
LAAKGVTVRPPDPEAASAGRSVPIITLAKPQLFTFLLFFL